jgi:succinate dehydrogenase flavin-adding protein (antitoxin of CptAB toxin-antitoxin module)
MGWFGFRFGLSPMQPLISMSVENLLEELDKDAELVRWLLNQMTTYDCRKQKLVALIFDRQTVISDVLRA